MKIVVFGATGQTGRQVVSQALSAGDEITAVVRDPAKLGRTHERLRVVRGDVFDTGAILDAVTGQDAVVSALGASSRAPTTVCSAGVRGIIQAMTATGVRRLVVVSNSAHTAAPGDSFVRRLFQRVLGRILKNPFEDLKRMESEIQRSGTDWTVLRPARLTGGPHTGEYRTAVDGHVPRGWSISRADVADELLKLVREGTAVGNTVGIAY